MNEIKLEMFELFNAVNSKRRTASKENVKFSLLEGKQPTNIIQYNFFCKLKIMQIFF